MLAAKQYTIREDYIIFKCSYTLNINSFNISSTLRTGLDNRNTWQILTDNELRNIDPSIIPGLDKNNLCSFNDNIKNNDMFSTVYDGVKAKKGYTCEFLDLHSIKTIYIYSNIGNYNTIAPNGSMANISKKYV